MRNTWIYRETRALLLARIPAPSEWDNSGCSRWGFGCSGWGSGCSGWGSGCSGWGSWCSGWGSGCSGWGSWCSGWGSWCSGWGSGFYRHPHIHVVYFIRQCRGNPKYSSYFGIVYMGQLNQIHSWIRHLIGFTSNESEYIVLFNFTRL
jgi:hypothetical protein